MIDIVKDTVVVPVSQIPGYRNAHAHERGNLKRVLMNMFAGIGDQVCAEPTLRYAISCRQKGEIDRIALASSVPDLYRHLPFDLVITDSYDRNEWLIFDTIPTLQGLAYEHISHGLTNCVDASSLYAFRMMLPTKDREIRISNRKPKQMISDLFNEKTIIVHPGKHWPSKTFPKWWWDEVLWHIRRRGVKPIIIGSNVDGNRTTVNVEKTGCIDIRGQTTLSELAWVCQYATVLLTNDSAPLHFAASEDPENRENSGRAWIGLIATCKHADYITHFRKGKWQWREVDHGIGGVWDIMNFLPNKTENICVDDVDVKLVEGWLPKPQAYADWALEMYNDPGN